LQCFACGRQYFQSRDKRHHVTSTVVTRLFLARLRSRRPSIDARKPTDEVIDQQFVVAGTRLWPRDDHVIEVSRRYPRGSLNYRCPEPSLDAISHDSIAHLLGHSEAKTGRTALHSVSCPRLAFNHKSWSSCPSAASEPKKLGTAAQRYQLEGRHQHEIVWVRSNIAAGCAQMRSISQS
jgi:hypothetical protein